MRLSYFFVGWAFYSFLFSFLANLSLLAMVLFSFYLAVLLFFCFFLFDLICGFQRKRLYFLVWQVSCVYVVFEMLKDRIGGGLSWGNLADFGVTIFPMNQILAIVGPYGFSFCLCFLIGCVILVLFSNGRKFALFVFSGIFLFLSLIGACTYLGYKKAFGLKKKILHLALLQPNISGFEKISVNNAANIWSKYFKLVKIALKENKGFEDKLDLLVLPETMAIYTWPDPQLILYVFKLKRMSKATALLIGSVFYLKDKFYNTAICLSKDFSVYAKKKLVPFGEYIPFKNTLLVKLVSNLMGIRGFVGFSPGTRDIFFLVKQIKLLPLICYEDSFSYFVRERIRKTGYVDGIIVLTNDCWFGKSFAQWFHLANSMMRAIEFHLPVIRSNNNGWSCIISRWGRPLSGDIKLSDLGKRKLIIGKVYVSKQRVATVYYYLGNSLIMFNIILCGIISRYMRKKGGGYGIKYNPYQYT